MRQVVPGRLQDAYRIGNQLAGGRIAKPKASILVTRQPLSPRSQSLHVRSADATVAPCGDEWQVTSLAEVDDVLSRGVKDPRRLPSGKQFVSIRPEDRVDSLDSHGNSLTRRHKKRNPVL